MKNIDQYRFGFVHIYEFGYIYVYMDINIDFIFHIIIINKDMDMDMDMDLYMDIDIDLDIDIDFVRIMHCCTFRGSKCCPIEVHVYSSTMLGCGSYTESLYMLCMSSNSCITTQLKYYVQ